MKNRTQPVSLQQLGLLFIILGLLFLIGWKLRFFLSAFLGAITIYILLRRIRFTLTEKHGWHPVWTSLGLIVLTFAGLFGSLGTLINLLLRKATGIDRSVYIKGAELIRDTLHRVSGHDFVPEDLIGKIANFIINLVPDLFNYTYSFAINLFMMCFILYFMLTGGRGMEAFFWKLIPLTEPNLRLLKDDIKRVLVSNILGIPMLIVLQGLTATIGYFIFGAPQAVFWGIITGFFSILPVLGTLIIWLPIGITLIASGMLYQGAGLLAFGFIVISNVDNLFRFMLMKKMADVHPLITVFGVIFGLNLLGIFGIIFGPLLLSVFFLLIRIYNLEYSPERYQEARQAMKACENCEDPKNRVSRKNPDLSRKSIRNYLKGPKNDPE